jgi:hypothetical protein
MAEQDRKPPSKNGGNGRRRWNNKKGKRNGPKSTQPNKFHGGKEEMNGHHFDSSGYGAAEQYVKTNEMIAGFAAQEYSNSGDIRNEVLTETKIVIPLPPRPEDTVEYGSDGKEVSRTAPSQLDIADYVQAKKDAEFDNKCQRNNHKKLYSLVWQQSTEPLLAKVRANRDFPAIESSSDGINLLRVIKLICYNIMRRILLIAAAAAAAAANVQVGETHEDVTQHMCDGVNEEDMDYDADLFVSNGEEDSDYPVGLPDLGHRDDDSGERHETYNMPPRMEMTSNSFVIDGDDFADEESFQVNGGLNGGRINRDWLLLDNQSTTDSISNPDLLTNIHQVNGSLTIHTQAGKAVTKLRGTLAGYGDVWYCKKGIANILSLANVQKTREVTYSSKHGNQFEVTKNDGTKRIFKQSKSGLYYYNMRKPSGSA